MVFKSASLYTLLTVWSNIFFTSHANEHVHYAPMPLEHVTIPLLLDHSRKYGDYSCCWRAYVFAENMQRELKVTLNNVDFHTNNFLKNIEIQEEDFLHRDFLGLRFGNYVNPQIFINLCDNARNQKFQKYPNRGQSLDFYGRIYEKEELEIYDKIVFFKLDKKRHPIAGNSYDTSFYNNLYRTYIHLQSVINNRRINISKLPVAHDPNQTIDDYICFLAEQCFHSEYRELYQHIINLHENEHYTFTWITLVSTLAGGSLTSHAMGVTIIKKNGMINYVYFDGANLQGTPLEKNIEYIVENPEHLKLAMELYEVAAAVTQVGETSSSV